MPRRPHRISAIHFILLFVALALILVNARSAQAEDLTVMSFNLRYASPKSPNSWPERRPVTRALISEFRPDVFGTQEGVYQQLKDIADDLPEYRWIGTGRDGGSRGEFMAIFYRPDRLEPLEFDHFWLSDTPEVIGSTTWGNTNRRMVTWVKFRDRTSDVDFYFINTHFDHQIQEAREKSAQLLLDRVEKLNTRRPIILVGDFNAVAAKNPAYHTLVGEERFQDTWTTAEKRGPDLNTFHNYGGAKPGQARIDWILTRGNVNCLFTEVVAFAQDGQYPSDHFPVIARLRFGGESPAPQE